MIPLKQVSERNVCGECTECCKVFGVEELNKRSWQDCEHRVDKKGCAIHNKEGHPKACKEFLCFFLMNNAPKDINYRPDHLGLIIHRAEDGLMVVHKIFESSLGNFFLNKLAESGEVFLLKEFGKGMNVCGPEEKVKEILGKVLEEAKQGYRRAWEEYRTNFDPDRKIQLEMMMDECQNRFTMDEWRAFSATLPGFLEYWKDLPRLVVQKYLKGKQ